MGALLQNTCRDRAMHLLADRFLRHADGWFDIATANPVTLAVHDAGSLGEQIAWAERCAMLIALRHPLLNPLLDFGAADATSLFESYTCAPPLRATHAGASLLVTHGSRFLEAHGVSLTRDLATRLLRPLHIGSNAPRSRPLGLVLQTRRTIDLIEELLAGSPQAGPTSVTLYGSAGSGVRTLAATAARLARMRGYVPVCAEALLRWPWVAEGLLSRHVCLLNGGSNPPAVRQAAGRFLAKLAARSARSHIHLTLQRTDVPVPGAIALDSMGTTIMSSMIYRDPDYGPDGPELLEAARRARGLPGAFLAALGGWPDAASIEPPACTVHESAAPYAPTGYGPPSSAVVHRSRIGSTLSRAAERAVLLEGRGRHEAAGRLLARAARVLHARGDESNAACCWRQLAWLSRKRGSTGGALEQAERAAACDASAEGQIAAGLLIAVCRTDESRLIEAEASLRGLLASCSTVDSVHWSRRCTLALARALRRDQRPEAALATLEPLRSCGDPSVVAETLALAAGVHLQLGTVSEAVRSARASLQATANLQDRRLEVLARRAMAEALLGAGDAEGVRTQVSAGLTAAASARLPLAALRCRGILLRAVTTGEGATEEAARLRECLERALRRNLPALVRRDLEAACRASTEDPQIRERRSGSASSEDVEAFLDTAQRAPDDQAAITGVLNALAERVRAATVTLVAQDGRVVATVGRTSRERPTAALQALASGLPVRADPARQPQDAAQPVRCGGTLLAAIGCRWALGVPGTPSLVHASLHAAGMALATHVRAILEVPASEPPPGVWGELLGESAGACALRDAVARAARAPFPVLVEGESGSGKELVARAIHKLSPRHARRFCAVNCAALSDELLEAELFGHTRGAFTGALTERAGLFEEADGGTLFLDEVGELSARAQAKLLRVVQEGEVRRVGENLPRRVDVRIVAATNRRLEHEAAAGRFRTDLRFRLDVLRLVVPPLRDRASDVPLLAQHFWRQACTRLGSHATLGPEAVAALSRHDWPGNVRELQNVIAWTAVHAPRRGRVGTSMLPAQLSTGALATGSFEAAREEFERRYVRAALAQAGGQRQTAARALGVSRQGLAKMLRRLGIEPDGSVSAAEG